MISTLSATALWGLGLAFLVGMLVIVGLWRGVLSGRTLRDRLMRRAQAHPHTPRSVRLQPYSSLFANQSHSRQDLYAAEAAGLQDINPSYSLTQRPHRTYRELRQMSRLTTEEFYRSKVFVSFVESAFLAHSDTHFWSGVLAGLVGQEQADRGFFFVLKHPSRGHPYLDLQHRFPTAGQKDDPLDPLNTPAVPPLLSEMGEQLRRLEPFTVYERRANEGFFSLFIPVCTIPVEDDRRSFPLPTRYLVAPASLQLHGCMKIEFRLSEERREAFFLQIQSQRIFYVQTMLFLARCAHTMHAFSGERTKHAEDSTISEAYMETWIRFLIAEVSQVQGFYEQDATRGTFVLDLGVLTFSASENEQKQLMKHLGTLNVFVQALGNDKDKTEGHAFSTSLLWVAVSRRTRKRFYVLALTPKGQKFLQNEFSDQIKAFCAKKFSGETSVSFTLGIHDLLRVETEGRSLEDF